MSAPAARRAHYTVADLEQALRDCGVERGDVLFSHVSMGMLGFPAGGSGEEAMFDAVFAAVTSVIGPEGTWLVPTYTYSFCRSEPFDPALSASTVGPFTDRFRKQPGVVRSLEPIFSVAGLGPAARGLLSDLPQECFGAGSLYERLIGAGAKTCNIGVGFRTVTFVHYTEQRLAAPYRFLKPFSGELVVDGRRERQTWLYNVGVLQDNTAPDLHALERMAAERGAFRTAPVGLGAVTVFTCADLDRLGAEAIAGDPWAMARGPKIDLVEAERRRLAEPEPAVELPPRPSMEETVRALCVLPAHPLSRAHDAGLSALVEGLPATVTAYRSGARTSRGVVPEAWRCRSASLETLSGHRLLSSEDHPFHVPYYSAKFSGEVSREELLDKVHTHPDEGAIPLCSLRGEQTWGLSCTRRLATSLSEERYRVAIETVAAYGEMRVAAAMAPGREPQMIAIVAHADHGGLANDGLSGAVVGAELMRRLLARGPARHGYLLLLAPKDFGAEAFFEDRKDLAGLLAGVVVLESLGVREALVLQMPHPTANAFEATCAAAMERCGEPFSIAHGDGPWLSASDLRGLPPRVGRVCFNRSARPLDRANPYDGFRSSLETAPFVSGAMLDRSLDALLAFFDALER